MARWIIGALLWLCQTPAGAADALPDAALARGEHIARLECSACHLVARDQEFPVLLNRPAPPFSEIANRPGASARTLQRFINSTHWDLKTLPMSMPSPNLSGQDLRAVTRYILSLQQH
jgi:mono/diheme cytochrome c family protein